MNKSLKTSLKMIEGLGKLFYGVYGYGPRTRLIKAKRDWEDALEVFLRHYAFERLSGFPRYSNAGIQAIKSVAGSSKKPPITAIYLLQLCLLSFS